MKYVYRAKTKRVIDGDTLELVVDLGFRQTRTERIRLLGVDTPEIYRGPPHVRQRGLEAKAFVEELLAGSETEWPLVVVTAKGDSFGRWLGRVTLEDSRDLSEAIIEAGHGVRM